MAGLRGTVTSIIVLITSFTVRGTMGAPVKRSDDVLPLETIVQNLSSQVVSLQAKLSAVENTLQHIQASEVHKVVFTASIHEASVKSSSGHIIPFSRVITNEGNAYDANTSAFTAPYDGQYMFFVSVDVSVDYRRLNIFQNGRGVIPGHNDVDDHHIFAGGAITLKAGDEVTIRHDVSIGTVDGGPEAIFCGFKI